MTNLTTAQIAALRKADAICFDLNPDGSSQIRAITRGKTRDDEASVIIPVDTYRVVQYTDRVHTPIGFHSILSAKFDETWPSLARLIKPSKRVALEWLRGNASPVLEEARLVRDELNIIIGDSRFRVAVQVGPDNSARMIRS